MRRDDHDLAIGGPSKWPYFEHTYDQLYEPLVKRLAAASRDWAVAEEAVQEAFYRALLRWDRLASSPRLEGWLFVVARNMLLKLVRRQSRITSVDEVVGAAQAAAAASEPAIEDIIERGAVSQQVKAAIMSLPPHYREVLLMHYYQGMSLEYIAAFTASPVGTIKARLHRARHALRKKLQSLIEPTSDGHTPPKDETPGRDLNR